MHPLKRAAKAVFALLLVLVVLALFTGFELQEAINAVISASPHLIILSIVLYTLSWPLRGFRYQLVLRGMEFNERMAFLTGAVFISQTANLVLPARAGDGVRAYMVKQRGVPYSTGLASLVVERLSDLAAVLVLGAIGFSGVLILSPGIPLNPPTEIKPGIMFYIIPLVFIVVIYLALRTSLLDRFLADLRRGISASEFIHVLVLSVFIWLFDGVVAVVVLSAFGVNITPHFLATVFLAVSMANLAKIVPLTPGGVGTYEAAFAAILSLSGLGWGVAFAAAVVDHAVKNLVTLLGGVVSSSLLSVSIWEFGKEEFKTLYD